jgi:hypothetical protein
MVFSRTLHLQPTEERWLNEILNNTNEPIAELKQKNDTDPLPGFWPQSTLKVAIANFWHTFHHDGKSALAVEGGGCTPTPVHSSYLVTITYKVAMYAPTERQMWFRVATLLTFKPIFGCTTHRGKIWSIGKRSPYFSRCILIYLTLYLHNFFLCAETVVIQFTSVR